MLRKFQKCFPELAPDVYVDPNAVVIGDVILDADVSIWPGAVLRGDVNQIKVGARTNIQDNTVCHVEHKSTHNPEGHPLIIGADVTIGHQVILHGCTIHDACLIGMGSIILDGAIIHPHVLIGAGSLVPSGKILKSGYLYLGSPVKQIRALTEKELAWFDYSAKHYVKLKNDYQENLP